MRSSVVSKETGYDHSTIPLKSVCSLKSIRILLLSSAEERWDLNWRLHITFELGFPKIQKYSLCREIIAHFTMTAKLE